MAVCAMAATEDLDMCAIGLPHTAWPQELDNLETMSPREGRGWAHTTQ